MSGASRTGVEPHRPQRPSTSLKLRPPLFSLLTLTAFFLLFTFLNFSLYPERQPQLLLSAASTGSHATGR